MGKPWVKIYLTVASILVIGLMVYGMIRSDGMPKAFVGKVDENGVVWVQLDNISDNTTIYVYYGDNVSSKQVWILK